jgi:hypothetical protein
MCGHGRPLPVMVTGGNVNDTTLFEQVLDSVGFRRPGPARPATRPGSGACGQRVLQPDQPRVPVTARDPGDHPRAA